MISQSYIDGLTRQVFIRDYILNGLFPCQSDIVRSIRSKKRNWEYNDRFEYRMLLATTNTGGTLNSQIFNPNVSLRKPNELTYGIFKATYGTVSDGFDVDMTINLETESARGSFLTDYAMKVHSMRVNVASLFKNFAINGSFGVFHRITPENAAQVEALDDNLPTIGTPFELRVPINVYASGFKTGRYIIKTSGANSTRPWGNANIAELYMVLDNQPRRLWLLPIGTVVTPWQSGQFLEVFGNRVAQGALNLDTAWATAPAGWAVFSMPQWSSAANAVAIAQWTATGTYTQWDENGGQVGGYDAGVGAMEGLADLFPWHVDGTRNAAGFLTAGNAARIGTELQFRNQPNRQFFATEQAGGMYIRQTDESIIDAIMNGVALTTATIPSAQIGVWMNPETMLALGEQENQDVRFVKQIVSSAPLIYQRGVTSTDYTIGSRVIPGTIQDYNLPTNIVVIGPRDDLGYNCWDNAMNKIDEYILETWSKNEAPEPDNISLPNDFVTKLDFSGRITYGSPVLGDRTRTTEFFGGNFIHPSNRLPIAFHEMGALFTEVPFAYTIVNLRHELVQPSDINNATYWPD